MTATRTIHPKQSVLFIDSGIADYQTLIDGAKPGTEVHVLDAGQDGLAQMAQTLNGRHGIDAIHIISHGAAGKLLIGSTPLTGANLQDYSDELAILGDTLSPRWRTLLVPTWQHLETPPARRRWAVTGDWKSMRAPSDLQSH